MICVCFLQHELTFIKRRKWNPICGKIQFYHRIIFLTFPLLNSYMCYCQNNLMEAILCFLLHLKFHAAFPLSVILQFTDRNRWKFYEALREFRVFTINFLNACISYIEFIFAQKLSEKRSHNSFNSAKRKINTKLIKRA